MTLYIKKGKTGIYVLWNVIYSQIPPLAILMATLYNEGQVVDRGVKNHESGAKW